MNVVNLKLPLMATIKETAQIMKELAVKQGITNQMKEYRIRELARTGKIVAVYAGKKVLINVDKLIEYMNTATFADDEQPTKGIRKIKV